MSKSPFAKRETEKFIYPAPLPKDDENIDQEVLAEEDLPWIEVRIPRSAADVDAVGEITQSVVTANNGAGTSIEQRIVYANRTIFGLLVEEWSFADEKPKEADYDRLDLWAAVWARAVMNEAVRQGTQPDFPKPTPSSSTKRRTGRAGSAQAKSSG
jgi:hypothetical protein